jgi:prepilin-type N-terminal cleavage/methylation domain-containing protein
MRKGLTLLEMLVAIAVVGVLIALLVPAVQRVRTAASATQSLNNVRQIAMGVHNLGDSNQGNLPGIVSYVRPYRGTLFQEVLPFLDQGELYKRTVSPGARPFLAFKSQTPIFINPLDPSRGRTVKGWHPGMTTNNLSVSSYAANGQFFGFYPRMADMRDGLSQTIWFAEHYAWDCNGTSFLYCINSAYPWKPFQPATFAQGGSVEGKPEPGDYYPITSGDPPRSEAAGGVTFQVCPTFEECDPRQANASSPQGLQICLGDGSARIIAPNISPWIFWGLVTPSGGEVASLD